MHRRRFLHPETLARTAGSVLGLLDVAREREEPATDLSLLRFSRRAMATTFELLLPLGTSDAQAMADVALDEVDRLEAQLTVYRDDSEVSRLNQRAGTEAITVEDALFDLLALASGLTEETAGAFDISTGALTKAWGFYKRAGRVPDKVERQQVMQRVGMKHVVLDDARKSVRYLAEGLEINLGSIGKGHAIDRAVLLLRSQWKLQQALIHGGHSSIYGVGTEPGSSRGWRIGLVNPLEPTSHYAEVRLKDRALGTSGKRLQGLNYAGGRLGHILDPRTGWPAEGMLSASALAPTAALADALATAFFILGVEKTREFCDRHPQIGAVLVPEESRPKPIAIGIDPADIEILKPSLT